MGGGAWLSSGPPRLTVLNAALRLDHSWAQAAGALGAACGAGLVAAALRRRTARVVAALAAAAVLLVAARLTAYRIELTDEALIARGLLQRSRIPWNTIGRVEVAPGALLVFDAKDLVLRLDTAGLTADQEATLERGIARRVREAFEAPPG